MSLEAAARRFSKRTVAHLTKKVVFTSTCECDVSCQKVLKNTYGCCNWPDITRFDASKETAFCTTHQRQCKIHPKTDGTRRN